VNQPDPALWVVCPKCHAITSRKVSAHQCAVCGWMEAA